MKPIPATPNLCLFFLVVLYLSITLGPNKALAQRAKFTTISQTINVERFSNKKFRVLVAVKIESNHSQAYIHFFARLRKKERKIQNYWNRITFSATTKSWRQYEIEGSIDAIADSLLIGANIGRGGVFELDDFQLEIETAPGIWENIPIPNAGFEEWDDENKPANWGGVPPKPQNYNIAENKEHPYQGKSSLRIISDGYNVEHSLSLPEINVDFGLEPVSHDEHFPFYNIQCMIQDKKGFIWLGTKEGLVRYDGKNYIVFRHEPEDSLSISGDYVSCIMEDKAGGIWVGTSSAGLNYFNRETEEFTRFQHREEDSLSLSYNTVKDILEDKDGNIWVGTHGFERNSGGLNRLDRQTGKFIRYRVNPQKYPFSLETNRIIDLHEDVKGNLWIALYGGGIARYDPQIDAFKSFRIIEDREGWGSDFIMSIGSDLYGNLWLGTQWGLYCFDPENETFVERYLRDEDVNNNQLTHNYFMPVLVDRANNIWMGHNLGLFKLDQKRQEFQIMDKELFGHPMSMLLDRENILWMNTSEGLYKLNPYKNIFTNEYSNAVNNRDEKKAIVGLMAYREDKGLWFTKNIKLAHLDQQTNQLAEYDIDALPASFDPYFLGSLKMDKAGALWLGTVGRFLNKFDPNTKEFVFFDWPVNAVRDIFAVHIDEAEKIWLGTWSGLFLFDESSKSFSRVIGRYKNLTRSVIDTNQLKRGKVYSLIQDIHGNIWCGLSNGLLLKFFEHERVFEIYQPFPRDDLITYGKNGIQVIHEDKQGALWLGTAVNGLVKFDTRDTTFKAFSTEVGLKGKNIQGIIGQENKYLWISTEKGLNRLDLRSIKAKTYTIADGLPSNYFNRLSFAKDPVSGNFFFGTDKGLVSFHPDSLIENTVVPPIVISSLDRYHREENDGNAISVKGVSEKKSIKLSYKDDLLVFKFAALSYSKPKKNEYAYKMEGISDQWIQLGTKNEVTFTNLAPGNYTLHLKGSNGDGVWNEEGTQLKIRITPPWYWAWYTKTLYLIMLLGGLYALYRWRTREHRQKLAIQEKSLAQEQLLNARLQHIDKLKDQFLANTSHELRTPLQGIIGLSESLFDKEEEPDRAEDLSMIISSGKRLNSLINDILDFSKLKNFDIQLAPKPIYLKSIVEVVLKNNAPLLKGKNIELINHVPNDLPPLLADENRLQQILYNLIGNAIKFTEKGHIKIGATPPTSDSQQLITVFVEDTGIGIPESKRDTIFQEFEQADGSISREFVGTGLGLSISKRLVELHGGNMWVDSVPGKGSTFYFSLPEATEKASTLIPEATEKEFNISSATTTAAAASGIEAIKLAAPLTASSEDRIKILVVDDEPINHQVLKNYLSEDQYLVTSVMSGQEAMEAIDLGVKFDMVLLDVMMPRMSGYEVCKKVREKYLASELPIIMVTAKNQIQDLVEGLSVGANDYIAKPFSKNEFLARVKTQLDLHRIFDVAGKFVPNEFIQTLGRERITEVLSSDHIEKEVTIFYSDIRGYTTLSEKMTPEENYRFISSFNLRLGPIIRKNHGFVNRYLGDGFLAIFQQGSDTALQAAIDIQRKINEYNEERKRKKRQPIKIGIGFHTGPLIMGIIGDQVRMDTAIVSDTVNTAARIEGLTKYYKANILFSEDSLQKMPEALTPDMRYLGKVQVKGKQEPLGIYECFAGDLSVIRDKKIETLDQFKHGLNQYFNREFADAASIFQKILKLNPEDGPARLLLSKSAGYISTPVPEDWTGVEMMKEK